MESVHVMPITAVVRLWLRTWSSLLVAALCTFGASSLAQVSTHATVVNPQPVVNNSPASRRAMRWALVIGNGVYTSPRATNTSGALPNLKNPARDAQALTNTLTNIGWEVTPVFDANYVALEDAVEAFRARIEKGDEALVFFSGHGLQIDGENYLLPVGETYRSQADVKSRSLGLSGVLERLNGREPATLVVLLDACRDNPLPASAKSASRGLAAIRAPQHNLIAYATQPGETASDGDGVNSPYTEALLEHLPTDFLLATQVLTRVAETVGRRTNQNQMPDFKSSLTRDVWFNDRKPEDPEVDKQGDHLTVSYLGTTREWQTGAGIPQVQVLLARVLTNNTPQGWDQRLSEELNDYAAAEQQGLVLRTTPTCGDPQAGRIQQAALSAFARHLARSEASHAKLIAEDAREQVAELCGREGPPIPTSAFVSGSIGLGALVGGGVFYALARSNWKQARALCPEFGERGGCLDHQAVVLEDRATLQANVATAGGIIGGAAIAAAVLFWVLDEVSWSSPTLVADVDANHAAVTLRGRF